MTKHLKKYLSILVLVFPLLGYAQVDHKSQPKFQNKNFPTTLTAEIEEALSYFPELWKTRIDFIFKDKIKNAVMQAQPRVRTLFKKKALRTYKIKISRVLHLGDETKPIEEVPHDILVGWIAHELGHVMDYLDRSSFQMIGFGFNYITSKNFLMNAEYEADKHAIANGCADHIIKTKNYILNNENLSSDYKARINRLYISPEEVKVLEEELSSGG